MKLSRAVLTILLSALLAALALSSTPDDQLDISRHLSGKYTAFDMNNILHRISLMASLFKGTLPAQEEQASYAHFAVTQVCPNAINVKVQSAGNKLQIPVPSGLRSSDRKCRSSTTAVSGADKSRNVSLEESLPSQFSTDNRDDNFFEASLPKDILQCHGNTKEPFSSITIASLKNRLVPLLRSTFTELGIPEHVLQDILGVAFTLPGTGVYAVDSTVDASPWDSDYHAKIKRRMRDSLRVLGKVNLLVVGRQQIFKQEFPADESAHMQTKWEGESSEDNLRKAHRLLTEKEPDCTYLGGGTFPQQAAFSALEKALSSLVPLFASAVPSRISISSQTFFPTDARYNRSQSSTKINTISFEEAEDSLLHAQGQVTKWFSVFVNGQECSVVKLFSLLESEQRLVETDSGLNTVTQARKLVTFFERMGSLGMAHSISNSTLRHRFPETVNRARDVLIKSSMYVGRVILAECYHIEDRRSFDVIFVQHPSPFFYCNQFPGLAQNITYPCSRHGAQEDSATQSQQEENSTSLFLVPTIGREAYLYASSAETAAILRNDVIMVPFLPSEEPLPSLSPEMSPESAFVLSSPGPFTMRVVPQESKRACFPANALVQRSDGQIIAMHELQLGDEVLVAPGVFSAVVLFTHADHDAVSDMMRIQSDSGLIVASEGHFLFVDGKLICAGEVEIGDLIFVTNGSAMVKQEVKKVVRESLRGLYNPQTKAGSIFVSYGGGAAVLASSYTDALDPYAAHAAITPLRLWHTTFGAIIPASSVIFPGTSIRRGRSKREASEVQNANLRKLRSNFGPKECGGTFPCFLDILIFLLLWWVQPASISIC